MKKKLFYLLAVGILVFITIIYFKNYSLQNKNVFDEIYSTEKRETSSGTTWPHTTLQNNTKLEQNSRILRVGENSDEILKGRAIENYQTSYLPEKFESLEYYFDFKNNNMTITAEIVASDEFTLVIQCVYSYKVKNFKEELTIERADGIIVENKAEILDYLSQTNVSVADIDNYSQEILTLIVEDWCSIYDSKFSPEDYGDVTVKTQWENW